MPFIPNMDQEDQPGQGAVAPGAGGIRTSPGGVGTAPSAGAAPASPTGAGGQFATLQSYLTANQGQAAPLAGKITSGIQNQYNTLQGQNVSTLGDIGNQVSANALPANTSSILSQEAANPVSFTGDQGNVKQFQNLLGATYSGPASAEGTSQYQKQQANINNAIATGNAQTGTEAGREQLLSQNEARPTTGVTALNSAILTQSPDYLSQVQGAYKPFSNLLSGLSSGAKDINQNIAKTQGDVSSANAEANQQIASQTQDFQKNLQTELANAQAATDQYNKGLQGYQTTVAANQPFIGDLQNSNLLALLGVANPFSQQYSAMNPPTANTVATPDQLATQAALNQLGNQNLNLIDPNAPVGGYTTPSSVPVPPDIAKLMDQIALADVTKNYVGIPGGTVSMPTTGVAASNLLGIPGGTGGTNETAGWQNFQTQVAPFQNLMAQLNQIYGTKYVSPLQLGSFGPIQGRYQLNT